MSKPEPFDIDANPADADWLHKGPPMYRDGDAEQQPEPEQPAESDEKPDEQS